MVLPISFTKERTVYLLGCLENGTPIQPDTLEGWTKNGMLALAGACFFGVYSQGPVLFPGADTSSLSAERCEFMEAQLLNDIRAAIEFYGRVVMDLKDEVYDEHFDPDVVGAIEHQDDGPSTIRATKGFKIDNG